MICPNCGRSIPDISNVCNYCGVRFVAPVQPRYAPNSAPMYAVPAPAPARRKKNLGLILGLSIGGAVTTIMIVIVAIFALFAEKCDSCGKMSFDCEGWRSFGAFDVCEDCWLYGKY